MHSLALISAALVLSTTVFPIWTSVLPEDWEEYIPEGAPGTSQPFRDDLFEGDIAGTAPNDAVANAITWDGRWKDNKVYYEISGDYDSKERGTIEKAMQGISSKTCIQFHGRTNQPDYLYIFSGSGCWTTAGCKGGRQELSLQKNGCVTYGIAAHELLHALGFYHEQSRSDRDDYVTHRVQHKTRYCTCTSFHSDFSPKAKFDLGKSGQFTKHNTDNLDFPYDYGSVMHYATSDMSKNGQPTILPKSKGVRIGQRDGPSSIDIKKVNKFYKCTDKGTPAPGTSTGVCDGRECGCFHNWCWRFTGSIQPGSEWCYTTIRPSEWNSCSRDDDCPKVLACGNTVRYRGDGDHAKTTPKPGTATGMQRVCDGRECGCFYDWCWRFTGSIQPGSEWCYTALGPSKWKSCSRDNDCSTALGCGNSVRHRGQGDRG